MTTAAANGITADVVYQRAVAEFATVGAEELGIVYQTMLQGGDLDRRKRQGSYYTPEILAESMSRFSLGIGLGQVGPDPEQVMRIVALDPACGSGVFLVHGARVLAHADASRPVGGEPSGELVLAVLPRVVLECVFGMDIDPVAVDLARLSLSPETCGAIPPAMLERHVVCKNALDGPDGPPAMEERLRHETETEVIHDDALSPLSSAP